MKIGVGAGLAPPVNNILDSNETNVINSIITNEIQINENLENLNTNSTEEQNIGGENIEKIDETQQETEEPLSQMQKDAKDILETNLKTEDTEFSK